jgi:BRCT domain type II-containing protein
VYAGAIRLNEQVKNWSKRAIDEEKFNRTIRKFPKEVGGSTRSEQLCEKRFRQAICAATRDSTHQ